MYHGEMTGHTKTSLPVRMECHITDLFFRSELIQLAGSDAGDRWFREQSRGAAFHRLDVLALKSPSSADTSKLKSPRPKPDAPSHCPAEPECPKFECKMLNQDTSNPAYLSMDEDSPFQLKSSELSQDCENDIGLLFTDAAHTVLTRLSSRNSQ